MSQPRPWRKALALTPMMAAGVALYIQPLRTCATSQKTAVVCYSHAHNYRGKTGGSLVRDSSLPLQVPCQGSFDNYLCTPLPHSLNHSSPPPKPSQAHSCRGPQSIETMATLLLYKCQHPVRKLFGASLRSPYIVLKGTLLASYISLENPYSEKPLFRDQQPRSPF